MYENDIAEFETVRNENVDMYFELRPQIQRNSTTEMLVEAGFRMAWNYLKKNGNCVNL